MAISGLSGVALAQDISGAATTEDTTSASASTDPLPDSVLNWRMGLRGSYTASTRSDVAPALEAIPLLTWTRSATGSKTDFETGGTFVLATDGKITVDDAHTSATSSWQIGPATILRGVGSLTYRQVSLDDTSLPAGTIAGPGELTGTLSASLKHDLGPFDVTGRLGATRFSEGDTTLTGGALVGNADKSYWQSDVGLRLGHDLGPLIKVFVDGDAKLSVYDAPSTTLGALQDGQTLTLRGGISYEKSGVLSAELSAGRSWYDYMAVGLVDQPSWVVGGTLTLTPDETLTLTGALDTTLGPSSLSSGDVDATLKATGTGRYRVNPYLTLRGSANATRTVAIGAGVGTWTLGAGAGFDLAATRNADWTGDYTFSRSANATGVVNDVHKVTLGVTIHR